MTRPNKAKPRTRWIAETLHPDWQVRMRADNILHEVKSRHHHLVVFDNACWGRVLVLDGVYQLTTTDEFIYHEMMAHVPLMSHSAPARVLIIGGGDGGILREVLKHPSVKQVTLVDIDRTVIDLSLKYFPEVAGGAFDDPRCHLVIADGVKYVAETREKFDAIIVDSSDPIGPSAALHSRAFFNDCVRAVKKNGYLVTQTGLANLSRDQIINSTLYFTQSFTTVAPYLYTQPCYFGGPFMSNLATNGANPATIATATLTRRIKARRIKTQYYNSAIHLAAFALPGYVASIVDMGRAQAAGQQRSR